MRKCETCQYAERLQYTEEQLKLYYSGASIGNVYPDCVRCYRYPRIEIKSLTSWCGEWRSSTEQSTTPPYVLKSCGSLEDIGKNQDRWSNCLKSIRKK